MDYIKLKERVEVLTLLVKLQKKEIKRLETELIQEKNLSLSHEDDVENNFNGINKIKFLDVNQRIVKKNNEKKGVEQVKLY